MALKVGPFHHFTVSQDHFREGLWIRDGGSRSRFQNWAECRVQKEIDIRDHPPFLPTQLVSPS